MKKSDYITLKEFSEMYDVKIDTIIRRIDEIKVSTKVDGEILILKGSRYPYRKNKKIKKENRYRVVLKAIDERKYIDESYFGIYKEDFNGILNALENEEYIMKIDSLNKYGANNYITTPSGSNALKKNNINFNININNNFGINL